MNYEPIFFDIETTGLNPLSQAWHYNAQHDAEVICIGIGVLSNWVGDTKNTTMDVEVLTGESEYELLDDAFDEVMEFIYKAKTENGDERDMQEMFNEDDYFFVGWNNRTFDHPYMGARYSRYRMDPYPFSHGWKRLDAMKAIQKETGRIWSQDDWMEEIGVMHEDDITGKEVPDLYAKGEVEPIIDHCEADIYDLMDIFMDDRRAMMAYFFDHYGIDADPSYATTVRL